MKKIMMMTLCVGLAGAASAAYTKLTTTTTYTGSGPLTTAGNWDNGLPFNANPGLVATTDATSKLTGQGYWSGFSVRQTGGELLQAGGFALRGGTQDGSSTFCILEIDDASNDGSYNNLDVSGRFTFWNQYGSAGSTGSTLSLLNGYAHVGEFWANSGPDQARVFVSNGVFNADALNADSSANANALVTMMAGGTGAFNVGDIASTAYMNQMLINFETASKASFTIGNIAGATTVGYWETKIAAGKVQIDGVAKTDLKLFDIVNDEDGLGTTLSLFKRKVSLILTY
jgi:hypothetical protein